MDFFQRQEDARRITRRLVVLFALAVAGVVVAVNLAAAAILFGAGSQAASARDLLRSDVAAGVTLVTLAIIATASLYKIAALSTGGPAVAQLLGGAPLDPSAAGAAERRLLNVVEEMALAAGTAVPTVYVLDGETGINAFAAGLGPDDAVIGVTRGALELLDRAELQGVVGHELSHLLNGDTRLNLRLIGMLHGILVIGQIGYWILRSSSRRSSSSGRKRGGGAILLFGVALLVIGYVGVFFAKLIKSAVSRQREFLADAASAQFTRNPLGLAGALRKIGGLGGLGGAAAAASSRSAGRGDSAGSRLQSPNAEQASHLFFGNGVGDALFAWMQTHPPLTERIRRLDPAFDGAFPPLERPAARGAAPPAATTPSPIAARVAAAAAAARALAAEAAVASVGNPRPQHVAYAAALRERLPPLLVERAREPASARAIVCALLLGGEREVRAAQLVELAAASDALASARMEPPADRSLLEEVHGLAAMVAACPAETRLPLLDLTVPALRRMSKPQWLEYRELVRRLVEADARLDLFELTLHYVLLRHVEPWYDRPERPAVHLYSLQQRGRECSVLLSALAWRGAARADAAAAFARGAAHLPGVATELLAEAQCSLRDVESSLRALDAAAPRRKRDLLTACAVTIAHDGFVTVAEGELLRAVAEALACPMPPLLPGQALASGRSAREHGAPR